ncbi:hypothetical protein [Streptomyces decoyicus]|nr:hypothetical protein OG532_07865 [Streptomyces decoyicus]
MVKLVHEPAAIRLRVVAFPVRSAAVPGGQLLVPGWGHGFGTYISE